MTKGVHMRVLFALAAVLLVAGCGSSEPYREAKGAGGVGYTDSKVQPARAEVGFQGDDDMAPERIYEFALLRAAQVTLDAGFDWFYVVPPEGAPSAAPPSPQAGRYGDFTPHYDPEQRFVTLDIAMGSGKHPPRRPGAFDARDIRKTLEHLK